MIIVNDLGKRYYTMENISNLTLYNDGMQKSMQDKLFFLRHIKPDEIDTIIDYGCADGTLLSLINNGWKKIGIDMNHEMLQIAQKKVDNGEFICENNLPVIRTARPCMLNLSSVLHEIYSYGTQQDVETFWCALSQSNYKYIVIRDLITDVNDDILANKQDIEKIKNSKWNELIAEFEQNHGSIKYQKNLLHFLLKYKYTENWNREVKENYFNLSVDELLEKIPNNYEVSFVKTYCLPFVKHSIERDFQINVHDTTHIQLILKRKEN